jgi:hypothetical protein
MAVYMFLGRSNNYFNEKNVDGDAKFSVTHELKSSITFRITSCFRRLM